MRIAVSVVVEANAVEIPQSAIDRQIAAPIVAIAFECDADAGLHHADGVGAAAQERIEARIFERRRVNRMLCQHRHQPNDQWQFAVVGPG